MTLHETEKVEGISDQVEGVFRRKVSTDDRSKAMEELLAKASAQDSGLSQDDIERMVKEAESFKKEDSRQRNKIEAKPGRRKSAGKLQEELKSLYWEHD